MKTKNDLLVESQNLELSLLHGMITSFEYFDRHTKLQQEIETLEQEIAVIKLKLALVEAN